MIRGQMPDDTSVAFSRGDGAAAGCTGANVEAIAWERVDFGARASVQEVQVPLGTGGVLTLPVTPFDPNRAFALAGGIGKSGYGAGEGRYAGSGVIGEMSALLELAPPSTLKVLRDSSFDRAQFTGYVVQVNP